MKSNIKILNCADCAVIEIEGVIGMPEKMQFRRPSQRVATYARFREALDEISMIEAHEITVNIRSTGGDVNDAMLIYEALRGLKGRVTTHCYGYVASAATIIAQAASEGCRELSINTLYLVHRAHSEESEAESSGNTNELLKKTDRLIAEIYAERSGRQVADFEALMAENGGHGRWLTADEAIEAGLADIVTLTGEVTPKNALSSEIAELLELPELPELPENEEIKQRVWVRLLKLFRWIFGGDEQILELPPVPTEAVVGVKMLAEVPKNGVKRAPRGTAAQLSSLPTSIKEVEDPSPFEYIQSSNESAYEADIENIRLKI